MAIVDGPVRLIATDPPLILSRDTGGATDINFTAEADGSLTVAPDGPNASFTKRVVTPASASGASGFRLPHGEAPSSPVNGDMWTTSAGIFVRVNGVTKTVTTT